MRRWRTATGETLAEAPPGAGTSFYLLDPSGRIRNTYRWHQCSLQDELFTFAYTIAGDELYCCTTCEIGDTIRQSERSELAGLIELSPDERPSEREVLDAIAAHGAQREANEAAIQRQVAAAAAPAGPAHAELALALADSAVRWPSHSRVEGTMLAILIQLAALPNGAVPTAATGSILAAARRIAGKAPWDEPVAPAARPPAPTTELAPDVAALFAALEAFVARLPAEATFADELADSLDSHQGRCLRRAAEHLRHALGEFA